jgi:hypothetical protein
MKTSLTLPLPVDAWISATLLTPFFGASFGGGTGAVPPDAFHTVRLFRAEVVVLLSLDGSWYESLAS